MLLVDLGYVVIQQRAKLITIYVVGQRGKIKRSRVLEIATERGEKRELSAGFKNSIY